MDRAEFMRQLEDLLQNVSPSEREEALRYYNDYFDDAGSENEQSVIEALGTPDKVAENIKRDSNSAYGENVFQRQPVDDHAVIEYQEQKTQSDINIPVAPQKNELPGWAIALIVVLCVLASPVLLGVAGGILGVAVGILSAWFALILTFGIVALVLLAVLVLLVVLGIICLPTSPLTGIALIGAGLFFGGVGILFLMLTVAVAGIATPAIFKGIVKLCRKVFKKKGVAV